MAYVLQSGHPTQLSGLTSHSGRYTATLYGNIPDSSVDRVDFTQPRSEMARLVSGRQVLERRISAFPHRLLYVLLALQRNFG